MAKAEVEVGAEAETLIPSFPSLTDSSYCEPPSAAATAVPFNHRSYLFLSIAHLSAFDIFSNIPFHVQGNARKPLRRCRRYVDRCQCSSLRLCPHPHSSLHEKVKATDEAMTSENWEIILNLCDKVLDEGEQG